MKSSIWFEKHRPTKLSQLALDPAIREKLEQYIEAEEIPHLLFSGPPGSGKTTISKILMRHCSGVGMTLNASSTDRGIDVIKTKVKEFAASMLANRDKKNVVFFDEADGLSIDAQRALKNTIETFEGNCRFIFTANEIGKIDDAIKSRCMHYTFTTIPKRQIKRQCKKLLRKEKIKFDREDMANIVDIFYPDIRSVINNLQACSIDGKLKAKAVIQVGIDSDELFKLIDRGKIGEIRELWAGTWDFTWLYDVLFNDYLETKSKDREGCAIAALSIAEYLYRDSQIVDREINATACLVQICEDFQIKVTL